MIFPYPVDLKEDIECEEQRYNFKLGVEGENLASLSAFLTSNNAVINSVIEYKDHVEVQGHFAQSKNALFVKRTVQSSENVVESEVPTATGPETMEV